jgi:hypothetical protein
MKVNDGFQDSDEGIWNILSCPVKTVLTRTRLILLLFVSVNRVQLSEGVKVKEVYKKYFSVN